MTPSGPIAIVGSTNRGDNKTQKDAKAAARQLGMAMAKKKLRILVYSDAPEFIELEIVEGYIATGAAEDRSIEVRYPEKLENGILKPPPFNCYFNDRRFTFVPDRNPDWEVSYYASISEIGGMLILQGGKSTLVAGVVALGYQKPVVVCSGFGGVSNTLLSMVVDRNFLRLEEKALLQSTPPQNELQAWAERCVDLLAAQADRMAEKKENELLSESSLKRRMGLRALTALSVLILALIVWITNWENRLHLAPSGILAILFLSSALAGWAGAMLWIILPYLKGKQPIDIGSLWGSGALGMLAGCIAALLFVLGKDNGFPDLNGYITGPEALGKIEKIKAEFFAKLIPASMISSLVAGLTLDRALATLTRRRPEGTG